MIHLLKSKPLAGSLIIQKVGGADVPFAKDSSVHIQALAAMQRLSLRRSAQALFFLFCEIFSCVVDLLPVIL